MNIILKPFAWLLLGFYNLTASYGWALILFALVVKVILFPFALKGKRSMVKSTMLQSKAQKLQKQYANNKQKYNEELQKLYEKEGVNPMSGCGWSMLPLLILLPLYAIIRQPMQYMMNLTADQVAAVANALDWGNVAFANHWITEVADFAHLGYNELFATSLLNAGNLETAKAAIQGAGNLFVMNFDFLGLNLASVPQWKVWALDAYNWNTIGLFLMPIVSAAFSILMSFITTKTNAVNNPGAATANASSNLMLYVFTPLMSLWIGYNMPAGLCVYWIINSILSIFQEIIAAKLLKKDYEAAAEARRKQELLDKEEEKRRKAVLAEERAKRAKEKKSKKKDKAVTGSDAAAISASRIGLRAYARGRAYDPDRFGGVTPYRDPELDEEAIQKVLDAKREKAEKAREEAELEAAVDAKVAAEMEALDGSTAEEVAEKIEKAHESEPIAEEPAQEEPADMAAEAEAETEKAWDDVLKPTGEPKDEN